MSKSSGKFQHQSFNPRTTTREADDIDVDTSDSEGSEEEDDRLPGNTAPGGGNQPPTQHSISEYIGIDLFSGATDTNIYGGSITVIEGNVSAGQFAVANASNLPPPASKGAGRGIVMLNGAKRTTMREVKKQLIKGNYATDDPLAFTPLAQANYSDYQFPPDGNVGSYGTNQSSSSTTPVPDLNPTPGAQEASTSDNYVPRRTKGTRKRTTQPTE
ncbi:hypothetical protein GALMADRAFT_150447 [Galerina marginata CBS 339.88]|uniref:Uncharacterized protein n=1 Tax=Galerina marginata (strain CBS 339.88) TaxID=685588 RepID=A0A067U3W7_GALM3|nr:hypothetical protein GALMADRAFT_150447 [Galerina marginata CBS 339.88]